MANKFKKGDFVIPICTCNDGFCKKYFNQVCIITDIEKNITVFSLDLKHYEHFTTKMLKKANSYIIRERLRVK